MGTRRLKASAPLLFLIAVLISALPCNADAQTLNGHVVSNAQAIPIKDATITLYGTVDGTTTSLATATTDPSGAFSLSYTCPASDPETYVTSAGGVFARTLSHPIDYVGGEVAVLGQCSSLSDLSGVIINELTTVAAEYALRGTGLGATFTNRIPLQNAIAVARNLVSITSGRLLASLDYGSGYGPGEVINMTADYLLACNCSAGLPPPPYPVHNVVADLIAGVAEDAVTNHPQLAFQPIEPVYGFYIALEYTGGGLKNPLNLSIDANGDAWIANNHGDGIVELSPTGVAKSPEGGYVGGGLNQPWGIAIDGEDNVWVTNNGSDSITELNSAGNPISPPNGYQGGGLDAPTGIAADSNDVWVANSGNNSLSKIDFHGHPVSPPMGYTGGGLADPADISLDGFGDVWVANELSENIIVGPLTETRYDVSEFNASGQPISPADGYLAGKVASVGIAVDPVYNDVWLGGIDLMSFSGVESATAYYACCNGIAVDAGGAVWFAGMGAQQEYSSGSLINPEAHHDGVLPGPGYYGPQSFGMAIDRGGNVWYTDPSDNAVWEVLGAAAPTKTPVVGLPTSP